MQAVQRLTVHDAMNLVRLANKRQRQSIVALSLNSQVQPVSSAESARSVLSSSTQVAHINHVLLLLLSDYLFSEGALQKNSLDSAKL